MGGLEDLDDLLTVHAADGAAGDGKVLGETADGASIHEAGAGHDTVGGELVLRGLEGASGVNEDAVLLEGLGIKKFLESLASGEFAGSVLLVHALFAAGLKDLQAKLLGLLDAVSCGHGVPSVFSAGWVSSTRTPWLAAGWMKAIWVWWAPWRGAWSIRRTPCALRASRSGRIPSVSKAM